MSICDDRRPLWVGVAVLVLASALPGNMTGRFVDFTALLFTLVFSCFLVDYPFSGFVLPVLPRSPQWFTDDAAMTEGRRGHEVVVDFLYCSCG